jgi:hypothetical protein
MRGTSGRHVELNPELVAMVKRLRRRRPKTGRQKSLRAISRELADLGYRNIHGEPFAAESIAGSGKVAGFRARTTTTSRSTPCVT